MIAGIDRPTDKLRLNVRVDLQPQTGIPSANIVLGRQARDRRSLQTSAVEGLKPAQGVAQRNGLLLGFSRDAGAQLGQMFGG